MNVRHRLSIRAHDTSIFEKQPTRSNQNWEPRKDTEHDWPKVIRNKILLTPKVQAPVSALRTDLFSQIIMSEITIWITPEKAENVPEIGQIDLDRNIMNPGLNSVSEPTGDRWILA